VPLDGILRTIEVVRILGVSAQRVREVAEKVGAKPAGIWEEAEVRRIAAWLCALGSSAEKRSARAGLEKLATYDARSK
jgi:hypothetical protein